MGAIVSYTGNNDQDHMPADPMTISLTTLHHFDSDPAVPLRPGRQS